MEKPDLVKFYCSEGGVEEVDKLVERLHKVLGVGEEFKEAREELSRVKEMALMGKELLRQNPEVAERVCKEMMVDRGRQRGEGQRQQQQQERGTMGGEVKRKPVPFVGRTIRDPLRNGIRSNTAVERGAPVHQGSVEGAEPDP